jgi:hypothetical protein
VPWQQATQQQGGGGGTSAPQTGLAAARRSPQPSLSPRPPAAPRRSRPDDAELPTGDPPKRRGRPRKSDAPAAAEAIERLTEIAGGRAPASAAAAAAAAAGTPAAPAAPPRWTEAAQEGAGGEDDPRRFPYHRRLQVAAQRGDPREAEGVLADMADAGLPPGPRAWHVLALAHLKAGDVDGALEASVRADTGALCAKVGGRGRGHRSCRGRTGGSRVGAPGRDTGAGRHAAAVRIGVAAAAPFCHVVLRPPPAPTPIRGPVASPA